MDIRKHLDLAFLFGVGGGVGGYGDVSTEIKENYPTGTFDETVNREAPYRAALKKVPLKLHEGLAVFPMRLNPSWNVGIIDDGVAFPASKDPSRIKPSVKPEMFVGSFVIGLKAKDTLGSGKATFNDGGILADRIENTAADVAKYMNKVYAGSNRGRLAIVESDGSSNFVAAKPLGVELLNENMDIEATTTAAGTSVRDSFSGHRITAIDYATRTVTYVKASDLSTDDRTLVAGDSIFIQGSRLRTIYTLPDIVDDGTNADTMFNVTTMRTTYPKTKANILGNGGTLRNLSEQLMLDAISLPRRRAGKKISRILSNDGQARKYTEFVAQERHFAGQTNGADPKYNLGYAEGSLQMVAPGVNAKIEVDYDIPPRSMFFLSWDTFGLYEGEGLDWIEDGGGMLKLTPTTGGHLASFNAYMKATENQLNLMPLANSRLDDLADRVMGDA